MARDRVYLPRSSLSALQGDIERGAGFGADVFNGRARLQLDENETATGFYLEDGEIGDDETDHAESGDRERAFFEDLRAAVFRGVLHDGDNAFHAGDQVHR